ncbi:MAG: hypothetical protein K6G31_02645 [Paludibacteraceae bacterium]|nr:hypothetical protein [Paludibacteraceae bacterium]
MKINSSTSYPYPIWGWKDDYKSTINDEDILITEISDKDNFVYELELCAKNEDIERLIEQGKAIYACVGYCPSTFRHYYFPSENSKFTISIPRKEVNNKIELKWMVLTKEAILEYQSDLLNDDYQGSATFPLGAMIGYITSFEINATICDELRSLDEIFVVVKNVESNDIRYSFDERKIKVKLPESQLEVFNNFGGKYPAIMHSTIVYQALVLAITKLKDEDDSKDWVYIIKQYIDVMESDNIPAFDEVGEEGYSLEQAMEITNYILQDPVIRMFSDIKMAEQQADQQSPIN